MEIILSRLVCLKSSIVTFSKFVLFLWDTSFSDVINCYAGIFKIIFSPCLTSLILKLSKWC